MTTQDETQPLKSKNVEVFVEEKPECKVELTVKASPELVKQSHKKALRSIAKEVSIPGFRKGKAPEALIEKKYTRQLDERLQQELGNAAFREAEQLAKIPPVNQDARITFDLKSHSLEEGAEMTYSFECEPKVPDIDPKTLEVPGESPETIDDAKVDEMIEHIRSFFGKWQRISDRAVEEGDYVTLDVEKIEQDPPEKAIDNRRFHVSKEGMPEWLYKLTLGMKVEEAKEGESSDDNEEETAPTKVRITIRNIETLQLPPLDDDLAKQVGVATIDEMRSRLKEQLTQRAEKEVKDRQREAIAKELLEKFPIDIPSSVVEAEMQHRIKQMAQDPSRQKELQSMSDDEKKNVVEEIKQHAENAIRLFYVCRAICNKYKIEITPEDTEGHQAETPLDAMFVDRNDLYDYKSLSQEQQAIVLSRKMLEKAEDYLIAHAKKVTAKQSKKQSAPKQEESSEE